MSRTLALALSLCVPGTVLHAQRIKLNAPLERVVAGDVLEQHVSSDGRFLVYAADPADTGFARLHRTAPDGTGPVLDLGASIRLGHSALEPGLFQLSADGARIVFRSAIAGESPRFELHGMPSDGSGSPVRLDAPPVEDGGVTSYLLSADGQWVVYRADQDVAERHELFAVPIRGGAAVRVNGPLFEHGDVQEDFVIGPDSRSVFFRANPGSSTAMDLFRGSVSGRQPPTRLHPVVGSRRSVLDFLVGPDGGRVIYRAYRQASEPVQLFAVPADASAAPLILNQTLPGGAVRGFDLARDGKRVVYQADVQEPGLFELFVVPIDRSQAPRRLSPPPGASSRVLDFRLDPLGLRAVFRFLPTPDALPRLYSSPLQPGPGVRLDRDDHPELGVAERFFLSPDGARVLYTKGAALETRGPLFSVPIDGLLGAVGLSPEIDPLSFQGFGADGLRAVFGLTSFRVDGSGDPLVLDPGPYAGSVAGSVLGKVLLYRGSRLTAPRLTSTLGPYLRTDLFRVPIDGSAAPVQINSPFPLGPIGEEVIAFDVASRAGRGAYRTTSGKVFGVELDGASAPRLLAVAQSSFSDTLVSPDGRWVVFSSGPEIVSAAFDDDSRNVLAPGRLALAITPDSQRLLYLVLDGFASELHSAPLDGSAASVRLSGPHGPVGSVFEVWTTPDSARVVFLANLDSDFEYELYSVPSDGSAPPIDLGGMFPGGHGVSSAQLSPDGLRVVFQTRELGVPPSLVSVPADGSAAPVLLASAQFTDVHIDATSQKVVFLVSGEIFQVPITGGGALLLTPPPFATAYRLQLSADGTRAVFLANQTFISTFRTTYDVFAVPVDGSMLPVKLNTAPAGPGYRLGLDAFFLGPAGHALFSEFVSLLPESSLLVSAPLSGGVTPAVLAPVFSPVLFTPDGLTSVFHQPTASGWGLFATATDGSTALHDLSGPAHSVLGGAGAAEITSDGSRVVYVGDLDEPGVIELYLSFLGRHRRSVRPVR